MDTDFCHEKEMAFLRGINLQILDQERAYEAVRFLLLVTIVKENILTFSQPNDMISIHFHQCRK